MLSIVIKKIIKNKWMAICMLTGSILTIAMLSAVPIYTKSVLQRMLVKNLEIAQAANNSYSGGYQVTAKIKNGSGSPAGTLKSYDTRIDTAAREKFGLPILESSRTLMSDRLLVYSDETLEKSFDSTGVNIATMSGFADHITITNGGLYKAGSEPGVVEVVMSGDALAQSGMMLGKTYTIAEARWLRDEGDTGIKVKVVGVYAMKDPSDLYWANGINDFSRVMFCDESDFNAVAIDSEFPNLGLATWYYAFEYHGLTLPSAQTLVDAYNKEVSWFNSNNGVFTVEMRAVKELGSFGQKEQALNRTLIVVEVPLLLLLAFYIYMVSSLMIDLESNEIAVMKSRGAGSRHIFNIYLIQGGIFSGISLIVGPLFGLLICSLLGGANGFLEFVNRKALPVALNGEAYLYAVLAIAFFLITMLLPAVKASRQTIVTHKQSVARASHKPIWQKLFLDVILLAIAIYGLYDYGNKKTLISAASLNGQEAIVDPLMLLLSTAFILGAGLLFLRLFPYLVRFVFFVGRRFWSPAFYLSLTQVGRSGGQEQFLMLFLVFTISVGIFSANSARTININEEDRTQYIDGADIVIKNEWNKNLSMATSGNVSAWIEVSPIKYASLDGVQSATKVYRSTKGIYLNSQAGGMINDIQLLAIKPDEFAKTAEMRNGLTPYHWYNYCNLLTDDPYGVILSASFARKNGIKVGDYITIGSGSDYAVTSLLVYAFVDYFPSVDPNRMVDDQVNPYFAIMNFDILFSNIPVQPYEIWIKKAPGVTSNHIYEQIKDKGLQLDERTDMTEDLVAKKNDPMLQGLNGTFTLCFVASLLVCFVGFLIYWIMSIKKRQLQFGIIRAMGLSMKSIIGMLLVEQLLISGTAIVAGIGIGTLASYYFIPLYSVNQSAIEQIIPFRIVSQMSDYMRLYVILAFILVSGFAVLARLISTIQINQALKLGED